MTTRGLAAYTGSMLLLWALLGAASGRADAADATDRAGAIASSEVRPKIGPLAVLPDDGRAIYFAAIDAATREIRIEICVLEDPQILERVQTALLRGVRVRVIVDRGKYEDSADERTNLAQYLTAAGGELHLSNPVFPRSFPKIVLADARLVVYGSACLDQTTFAEYRDFAHMSTDQQLVRDLGALFENDWTYSAPVGVNPPPFNPTSRITLSDLVISPVNGADRLVRLYQDARRTLDVYTELLGNPTLESELVAAVKRGVRVRLIAPIEVNGGTKDVQESHIASLTALSVAGVHVHVSGPGESAQFPYMHARADIADGETGFLGSVSLSVDSVAFNREMGLIVRDKAVVRALQGQFGSDYLLRTRAF